MARHRPWSKIKKLTRRIARGFTDDPNQDSLDKQPVSAPVSQSSTLLTNASGSTTTVLPNMAEGEEDYSSLPLTDRWVHKVCCPETSDVEHERRTAVS